MMLKGACPEKHLQCCLLIFLLVCDNTTNVRQRKQQENQQLRRGLKEGESCSPHCRHAALTPLQYILADFTAELPPASKWCHIYLPECLMLFQYLSIHWDFNSHIHSNISASTTVSGSVNMYSAAIPLTQRNRRVKDGEYYTPLVLRKSTSSQDTSQKEILWLLSQFNIHYTQNPEELMLKAPQGSENQNKKDMQNVATFFPHTHPITTKISNHSTDKDFLVCKKKVQR